MGAFVWKPATLPNGIEAAAYRLAAATSVDGYKGSVVSAFDRNVYSIQLTDVDGGEHYLKLINGDWYEGFAIDDERSVDDGRSMLNPRP